MICAGFLSGKHDACEVRIDSNLHKWICWIKMNILTIDQCYFMGLYKIKLWRREENIKRGNGRIIINTPHLTSYYCPDLYVKIITSCKLGLWLELKRIAFGKPGFSHCLLSTEVYWEACERKRAKDTRLDTTLASNRVISLT